MIEKKLATRPNKPARFTNRAALESAPYTARKAPTSGAPWVFMAFAPAPPGTSSSTMAANTKSTSIAAMMPRGMSRPGSTASSAASGTPSTARNSHMAKGSAAQMPTYPSGRKALAPAARGFTAMSNRLAVSKCGNMPARNTRIASTARTVMPIMMRSASPAPQTCRPTNTA